jgi:hypothetical protein
MAKVHHESNMKCLYKTIVKGECLRRGEVSGRRDDIWDETYIHHGRILLTALDKLAIGDAGTLVLVHTPEYLVYPLHSKSQGYVYEEGNRRTFSGVSSFSGSFSI